jgi:hypothetical protein
MWYDYEDLDGNTAMTTRAVDIAASRGILVVTAAGNEGGFPWPTLLAPADADSVIAVGAVDALGEVSGFSSRGPTYDGRIKPDVMAQGEMVATISWQSSHGLAPGFGTSAATPLVAGACALILQKNPDWSPIQIRDALRATANHADDPDNDHGWGIINSHAASNYVHGIDVILDARPGSCENPYNPRSHGVLPVLISGSEGLDVADIDVSSLDLSGGTARHASVADLGNDGSCPDQAPDGYDDLLVKFDAAGIAAAIGPVAKGESVTLSLNGTLQDGTALYGETVVRIVGGPGDGPVTTGDGPATSSVPQRSMLHPNIPNPFNPTTTIRFDLAGSGRVTLRVFDVRGRVVRTLVDGLEPAGHRLVEWDGRNDGGRVVPSGTYFYRLTAPGFEQTRTMLMLK